jgi:hypothetical protein
MLNCGRCALFIGIKTSSTRANRVSEYVKNFDILQEPKEYLFELSIVRYSRDGHYGKLNSFSIPIILVTKITYRNILV